MAKILSVELLSIPDVINVSDNVNDITVVTTIHFHEQDIKQNMEYCLHLFVYDIHGNVDLPLVLPNWDESSIVSITSDRKDDFLGQAQVLITASKKETIIKTPMALHLGKLNKEKTYFTRKLEVFATAAPIIGRVSKWSLPFEAQIEH
jgi:hypothetical protein